MTDLTDQDRRAARKWAERIIAHPIPGDHTLLDEDAAARIIIATVEAPAPTLAEELREFAKWVENPIWRETKAKVESMADRAEQIEQERDEARAEVERLTAERDRIASGRHITYAEVDGKPVQEGAESTNPADVEPGEAWLVDVDGKTFTAVKTSGEWQPWHMTKPQGGIRFLDDDRITLVSRLVPEPRTVTAEAELDALPHDTIIMAGDTAYQRGDESHAFLADWWHPAGDIHPETSTEVLTNGPATILWTPEGA